MKAIYKDNMGNEKVVEFSSEWDKSNGYWDIWELIRDIHNNNMLDSKYECSVRIET